MASVVFDHALVGSLQSQGNASAAVTAAVRRVLPEARRARHRAAADAFGEHLRAWSAQQTRAESNLIEASNDIALHGSEW